MTGFQGGAGNLEVTDRTLRPKNHRDIRYPDTSRGSRSAPGTSDFGRPEARANSHRSTGRLMPRQASVSEDQGNLEITDRASRPTNHRDSRYLDTCRGSRRAPCTLDLERPEARATIHRSFGRLAPRHTPGHSPRTTGSRSRLRDTRHTPGRVGSVGRPPRQPHPRAAVATPVRAARHPSSRETPSRPAGHSDIGAPAPSRSGSGSALRSIWSTDGHRRETDPRRSPADADPRGAVGHPDHIRESVS